MRTMYDAVTARNILGHDETPEMVAGYVDRIKLAPWSAADWALFPGAVKVRIVKKASTNDGHVLDVEPGDATPAEAPGWVRMRRAAGVDPTVYMNASTWPAVRAAFRTAGVPEPHYWVAKYDKDPAWPAGWAALGCVAKQYLGDYLGIDKSSVADRWPGVDAAAAASSTGGAAASTTGVELMERITVTPPNNGENAVRLNLPGGSNAKVIVRPQLNGDGKVKAPMWVGDIFAWGQDGAGVGHNPTQVKGYNNRLDSHREYPLPGALWCDLNYSSSLPFTIDIVG